MAGPLAKTVVLDLTRILAGPWCTQNLADLGAEVIKIERPGSGDDTRHYGPPWLEDRRDSVYYASANRGKKSVTVDLAKPKGQELIRRLAKTADVVVENYKVGDLERYGLGYEDLCAINPRIIYCSITGYGQTGPCAHRPGYDFVFQGEGGLMSVTGERDDVPGGGPQKVGVAVTDIVTGMYAVIAILAALNHRNATGRGQYIDLSLFDCITAFGANHAATYLLTGCVPVRYGNAQPFMVPYQTFKTADGYIIVAAGNDAQWQQFCAAIERPDLATHPSYAAARGRVASRAELISVLEATFLSQPSDHWLERLLAHNIPHGRINNYKQVFEHPQIVHRGMRAEIPCADGSRMPIVANPIKFSETPVEYRLPPPLLSEHTREVLSDVAGLDEDAIKALEQAKAI